MVSAVPHLTGLKTFLTIDNILFSLMGLIHLIQIKCGVPQGSILGPLLSLIYITEMYDVSKVLYFILFADDTNIFFSHKI